MTETMQSNPNSSAKRLGGSSQLCGLVAHHENDFAVECSALDGIENGRKVGASSGGECCNPEFAHRVFCRQPT